MTRIHIRPIVVGGVAALLLSSTAPVFAQPAPQLAQFTVATSDLDLTSAADIEKLRKRVDSTIRWACGPVTYWRPSEIKAMAECRTTAEIAVEPMVRRVVANGSAKFAAN